MSVENNLYLLLTGAKDSIKDDTIKESEELEVLDGTEIEYTLKGKMINVNDVPTDDDWFLPEIRKRVILGNKEKELSWVIGFDREESTLIILRGYVGGAKSVSRTKVLTNQSGRSVYQQAFLEASKRYSDKIHEGYQSKDEKMQISVLSPMLANEYKPGGINPVTKRKIKSNVDRFPVCVMRKFDGIRSLACIRNGKLSMTSRENHDQVYTPEHLLHVRNEVEIFIRYLPEGTVLDGELYCHGMTLPMIQAAVTKRKAKGKGDSPIHEKHKDIKYYIFELIDPNYLPTRKRFELLTNAYAEYLNDGYQSNNFVIVGYDIANSHEEIIALKTKYVEEGYEGAMIRHLEYEGMPEDEYVKCIYRHTRCVNLLKVKDFIDEEAKIIGVTDGRGCDEGLAIFIILDKRGNKLNVRPKANFEQRSLWYRNPNKVIGKQYTFKYFDLSKDGIPRFPVGVAFRKGD